jgi:mannose-6-phosphate isomerase-like protein (cupin superfamily)
MTKTTLLFVALLLVALLLAPLHAADPTTPIVWTAKQLSETETKIRGAVDPARHLGLERLLDSATLIYRDGPSEAEVHQKLADFITVRSGEGEIVIGGKIVNGKTSAPDELRGSSIEGGTRYKFSAGDALYVPANTVHQFFVAPGRNFVVTIVKITPKP